MEIPFFQVDAFTKEPFKGNPAAVCILEREMDEKLMQDIAMEMNLSETAFAIEENNNTYALRWFTPETEVPLCGHATLATALVLFEKGGSRGNNIMFNTKSGKLAARRRGKSITLNLPSENMVEAVPPRDILDALGVEDYVYAGLARNDRNLFLHLHDEKTVKQLEPNFEKLKRNQMGNVLGIICTASGTPPYDFISRYFAPWVGVNEDPVTGAAHTALTPYWTKRLSKNPLRAYQASRRGGELMVELTPDNRTEITGSGKIIMEGKLFLEIR